MENTCHICRHESRLLFQTTLLQQYPVNFFQCTRCGFIQTESPYWLKEAYSSAIATMDIGLAGRNLVLADKTEAIIRCFFNGDAKFLDYGGGYGLFVRLMRDKGYDYYRQDMYCENIFAKGFDLTDLPPAWRFELLTAFEVLEHLEDPVAELEKMFGLSDNILFSTELQPANIKAPDDWWYFVPETGQHISLYSRASLEILAKRFQKHLYTNGANLHLFSSRPLNSWLFRLADKNWLPRLGKRTSLLQQDFSYIKQKR